LLVAALILLVVGAVVIKLDGTPERLRQFVATAPLIGANCPSARLTTTSISITVAPEIRATVTRSLAALDTTMLADHQCVNVVVQAQPPAETIQSAQLLPLSRAPDIWIPDSSLWISRVPRWQLHRDGSFASSPVVVATSQAALDKLGWTKQNPTWLAALAGTGRPLALPQIAQNAAGLSAVIALWQSLGKGQAAQQALAGTVLAAGRAGVPTETQAIAAAQSGSADAPLLPTSEQSVGLANTVASTKSELVFVHPTGGSPALDYPVLTLLRSATPAPAGGGTTTVADVPGARDRAVRAVVAALFSSRAADLARAAGFQVAPGRESASATPSSSPLATTGSSDPTPVVTPSGSPLEGLTPEELAALVDRITLLSAPSRQLVIFDLSGSMAAQAGNGETRIQFAATAAQLAGNLLTDNAQAGLWGFSRDLDGKNAIIKLSAVEQLGAREGTKSHREVLNAQMTGAAKKLGGDGTALYSTAVAGMVEMNRLYDPRAGNAVVIFTDGANFDPGGPSLDQTLQRIKGLYNPAKPVRLICIGIGKGADMQELSKLSAQAGGLAYLANNPKDLPTVLFLALNSRKQ
jgi:hypothetical protein